MSGDADPVVAGRLADCYGALRGRCLTIARSLDDAAAAAMVPCCPAWRIHDLLAHMSGVAADICAGNIEGATTDPWTEAQVRARRTLTLAEICDEWEARGTEVEDMVRAGVPFPAPFFADAFTHEWDLRQAVTAPAVPDLTILETAMPAIVSTWGDRLDDAGLAAVDLSLGDSTHRVGSGGTTITFDVDPFTFVRVRLGRRSRDQVEQLGWGPGVTTGHIDALFVFGVSDADIVDPTLP